MLRSLKHPHTLCRFHGFQVTTTDGGAATLDVGSQEGSVVRSAAGKATITLNEKGVSSGGVVFVTPGANTAQGSFADFDTVFGGSTPIVEARGASGNGDDGTIHALVGVLEDGDLVSQRCHPLQSVKSVCTMPRMLVFRVSAAGTLNFGKSQATCSKASSVYTLTFTNPFGRTPTAVATAIGSAAKAVRITAISATSVSVETYDPVGGALEDNPFDLVVLGWDSPDTMSAMRRSIKVPFPMPRIELYTLDGTASPAALSTTCDGTVTDNGTGDWTITFKEPFARIPAVLVTGKDFRAQQLATATTTTCRVGAFNLSGASHAAVDDKLYVAAIGTNLDDVDY